MSKVKKDWKELGGIILVAVIITITIILIWSWVFDLGMESNPSVEQVEFSRCKKLINISQEESKGCEKYLCHNNLRYGKEKYLDCTIEEEKGNEEICGV